MATIKYVYKVLELNMNGETRWSEPVDAGWQIDCVLESNNKTYLVLYKEREN